MPKNDRQWYTQKAAAIVEAAKPARLGEVSAEQITAFFPGYAREQQLSVSEWQFRQIDDVVQLVFVHLASSPGAREVDWDQLRRLPWTSLSAPQ